MPFPGPFPTTHFSGAAAAVSALAADTEAFTISVANGVSSDTSTITSVTESTTGTVWSGNRATSANIVDDFHDSLFRIALASSTTVSATRSNTGNPFLASGTVVPFDADFIQTVHRGTVTITGAVTSAESSAFTADINNCAISYLSVSSDAPSDEADHVCSTVEMTDKGGGQVAVTARRGVANGTIDVTISFEIWEFKSASINSIQEVEIDLGAGVTTNTATITSVDTNEAITLFNGTKTTRVGSNYAEVACTMTLTNATTVTATRGAAAATTTLRAVVIEFVSGTMKSIQRKPDEFVNEAAGTTDVTITAVDLAKSVVAYHSWRWDAASPDWTPNLNMFTMILTSTTNVRVERFGTTASDMYVSFEVWEFN